MLVVLPPSETKVAGGLVGTRLDFGLLKNPELTPLRETVVQSLLRLCADSGESMKALKLGPQGAPEVERNRQVQTSPVMPALERYSGVVYDALGVKEWSQAEWTYAENHLAIFSALFGLIGARDPIPAYRLSWDSRLDLGGLRSVYQPYRDAIWGTAPDFVLDLRSEGYRSLSPIPEGSGVFVSMVKPGTLGSRKTIGHHNKSVKGRLVADLVNTQADMSSVADLVAWGATKGWNFDASSYREDVIDLVVEV